MHIDLLITGLVIAAFIALTVYNYHSAAITKIKTEIADLKADLSTLKSKIEADAKAVVTDSEAVAKKL